MLAKVMRRVCHGPPTLTGSAVIRRLPSGVMDIDDGPKGPSATRILIWVLVGGVGIYMLASGIIGIVNGG